MGYREKKETMEAAQTATQAAEEAAALVDRTALSRWPAAAWSVFSEVSYYFKF